MYKYTNCPVCQSLSFSPFITCEDYTVSHEKFSIVSCDGCGFKVTDPRPNTEKLGQYYQSEDYISHSDTKKGLVARLYHQVRNHTLTTKLRLVSGFVPRGTILDFGCGTGMFLRKCQASQWNTTGVEPDQGAAQIASRSGVRIHNSLSSIPTGQNFDVITLWHVLEHVPELNETLEWFHQRLNPAGVLIIAVPNYRSLDATHYGAFWAAYDVPRHLYHFDPSSMQKLANKAGFKLVEKRPMKFDSFYVSMLSEKYKTGRVRYLPAFISGLRSNFAAARSGNYSSLIYIFRKS
jgi:2-polyprenyl-3-methyl-5-hydroxy-6-metoxy-1,4-benzoquinol methylase